jgi:hypothetical protein
MHQLPSLSYRPKSEANHTFLVYNNAYGKGSIGFINDPDFTYKVILSSS